MPPYQFKGLDCCLGRLVVCRVPEELSKGRFVALNQKRNKKEKRRVGFEEGVLERRGVMIVSYVGWIFRRLNKGHG